MRFEVVDGKLNIVQGETTIISDITAYMEYPGTHDDVLTRVASGGWSADNQTATCENMQMEIQEKWNGFMVRTTFINTGDNINKPGRFVCFSGNLGQTIDLALTNHTIQWPGTNKVCEMQSLVDTVRTVYNAIYESADHTVFQTEEGNSYVFGVATYRRYFSGVTFMREGRLAGHCFTETQRLNRGDSCTSEWFLFSQAEDCVSGLEHFSRIVADLVGVERITKENPAGFCTWYYYGGGVYPHVLRQNMEVLDAYKEKLPVKYIQIDDGWENGWIHWQPNDKFPDMKAMADEIKAHGYLPGIWVAPFGGGGNTKEAEIHPEWFAHTPDGEVWKGYNGPCVDYTNPECRQYMSEVFHRISYDWGYRYIKMDIITNCLAVGVYHDKNATAMENYRLGLETIRSSVTEDTFLLGCTAPFGPAIGLVDGMRVTCDVFERWESIRNLFNEALKRYHYHRNYFLNDGDCLIIRKAENEDEECFRLCTRTDTEIQTYVTAMAATGGILMLADKLPNMKEEQLEMISKLFPVNQEAALPLDLMEAYIPGVLDFGYRGATRTVAFINWGDVERTFTLDMEQAFVWEFWEKKFDIHQGGKFAVKIAPHASAVYYFTDCTEGAIVGSDASVIMQTQWKSEGTEVAVRPLKKGEHTYIALREKEVTGIGCQLREYTRAEEYVVYEVIGEDEWYRLLF